MHDQKNRDPNTNFSLKLVQCVYKHIFLCAWLHDVACHHRTQPFKGFKVRQRKKNKISVNNSRMSIEIKCF